MDAELASMLDELSNYFDGDLGNLNNVENLSLFDSKAYSIPNNTASQKSDTAPPNKGAPIIITPPMPTPSTSSQTKISLPAREATRAKETPISDSKSFLKLLDDLVLETADWSTSMEKIEKSLEPSKVTETSKSSSFPLRPKETALNPPSNEISPLVSEAKKSTSKTNFISSNEQTKSEPVEAERNKPATPPMRIATPLVGLTAKPQLQPIQQSQTQPASPTKSVNPPKEEKPVINSPTQASKMEFDPDEYKKQQIKKYEEEQRRNTELLEQRKEKERKLKEQEAILEEQQKVLKEQERKLCEQEEAFRKTQEISLKKIQEDAIKKNIESNLWKRANGIDEQILMLTQKKNEAVENEEYDEAHNYKAQIEALQAEKEKLIKKEGSVEKEAKRAVVPKPPTQLANLPELKPAPKRCTVRRELPESDEFIQATINGKIELAKELLNNGMSVDSIDRQTGNTAMHFAASYGKIEVASFLMENGFDIKLKNRKGQSPLHLSIEKRQDNFTKWLLENTDIDPYQADNLGKTPLDIALVLSPLYQEKVMEIIQKKKKQKATKVHQQPKEIYVEDIDIYLKKQKKITVRVSSDEDPTQVLKKAAEILQLQAIVSDLEIAEESMGKERGLKPEDNLIELKAKWTHDNPLYFKFLIRVKRGAPNSSQMKFRDVAYK